LNYQNNVGRKLIARMLKFFAALSSTFKHFIYFDDPTKLFLDLYLAKYLDTSTKLSVCIYTFLYEIGQFVQIGTFCNKLPVFSH